VVSIFSFGDIQYVGFLEKVIKDIPRCIEIKISSGEECGKQPVLFLSPRLKSILHKKNIVSTRSSILKRFAIHPLKISNVLNIPDHQGY